MSLVDHETLKANYESLVEKLANDPDAGLMRPYVSTRLIENVSVESTFEQYDKEYTFYGDEAKSRAGFERGPSPMRYFLNGVAFCLQGWRIWHRFSLFSSSPYQRIHRQGATERRSEPETASRGTLSLSHRRTIHRH